MSSALDPALWIDWFASKSLNIVIINKFPVIMFKIEFNAVSLRRHNTTRKQTRWIQNKQTFSINHYVLLKKSIKSICYMFNYCDILSQLLA